MTEYAIALGTFDGMHKGHISVIKAARESGYPCVAVTFSIPPKALLQANSPRLLMTAEGKKRSLGELGVEKCDCLDFDAVRDMSPVEFLDFICKKHNAKMISCGFNYRFGKNAQGDTEFLKTYCKEKGIKLHVARPVKSGGVAVSSTVIREMIEMGEIEAANKLLYKPFGFSGAVIHGDSRGRTIGFPTINQLYPHELVLPKFGVYSADAYVNGKYYRAVTNVGMRPTFRVNAPLCESYLLCFDGDIYGQAVEIRFKRFLRGEEKFSNIDELKSAIRGDVSRCEWE